MLGSTGVDSCTCARSLEWHSNLQTQQELDGGRWSYAELQQHLHPDVTDIVLAFLFKTPNRSYRDVEATEFK